MDGWCFHGTTNLSHRHSCVINDSSQLSSPSLVVWLLVLLPYTDARKGDLPKSGVWRYSQGPTWVLRVRCRRVRSRAPPGPNSSVPSKSRRNIPYDAYRETP